MSEPVIRRHADHDPALICRPALGYGLCEVAESPYVAPARFVLTVLHRKGDAPGQPAELAAAEPIDGWTACGRPMLASELWRSVDGRDGDQMCTGCMPRGGARAAVDEPEATLW